MRLSLRFILLLVAAWLAEAAIAPYLAVRGVKPDLVLIVVATQAFLEGPAAGATAGFAGGLLQDLLVARSVGLNLLAKTITGYLSGQVERTVFGSSSLLPTLAMFVVSLVNQFLYIVTAFLAGEQIEVLAAVRSIVLPAALYTSLITFFVFASLCRVLSEERQETVFR